MRWRKQKHKVFMSDLLGYELWGRGKKLAQCSPSRTGGWYWYTLQDSVNSTNSLNTTGPVATHEEAQAQAFEHFKQGKGLI
jgi:hypothetical protein